jgi:hypothetical protein
MISDQEGLRIAPPLRSDGIVKLMDHNLIVPQYVVVMVFLNTLYCLISHLVILNLTMPRRSVCCARRGVSRRSSSAEITVDYTPASRSLPESVVLED